MTWKPYVIMTSQSEQSLRPNPIGDITYIAKKKKVITHLTYISVSIISARNTHLDTASTKKHYLISLKSRLFLIGNFINILIGNYI